MRNIDPIKKGARAMERKLVMPEEVGFSTKCLERIRPALQGYVDRKEIAGLSTMVARQGKIVHSAPHAR
jgi:hypothetical protein